MHAGHGDASTIVMVPAAPTSTLDRAARRIGRRVEVVCKLLQPAASLAVWHSLSGVYNSGECGVIERNHASTLAPLHGHGLAGRGRSAGAFPVTGMRAPCHVVDRGQGRSSGGCSPRAVFAEVRNDAACIFRPGRPTRRLGEMRVWSLSDKGGLKHDHPSSDLVEFFRPNHFAKSTAGAGLKLGQFSSCPLL